MWPRRCWTVTATRSRAVEHGCIGSALDSRTRTTLSACVSSAPANRSTVRLVVFVHSRWKKDGPPAGSGCGRVAAAGRRIFRRSSARHDGVPAPAGSAAGGGGLRVCPPGERSPAQPVGGGSRFPVSEDLRLHSLADAPPAALRAAHAGAGGAGATRVLAGPADAIAPALLPEFFHRNAGLAGAQRAGAAPA